MIFYSSILGIPIICSEDNSKLGMVKDILYCSKKRLIFGLIIEEQGIFNCIKYIPIDHIKEVNETSIITDVQSCIRKLKYPENFCNKLGSGNRCGINSFVYLNDRKLIGQVRDIIFDLQKHKIEGYVVSKSYSEDIFSKRVVLNDNIEVNENSNTFRILN